MVSASHKLSNPILNKRLKLITCVGIAGVLLITTTTGCCLWWRGPACNQLHDPRHRWTLFYCTSRTPPIARQTLQLNIHTYLTQHTYLLAPSLVVRALDSRLDDGREFDSRPLCLVLAQGRVKVFGRENHLSISPGHPDQLSLLPSVGWEMSTSQSAVTFCGWEVKTDIAHCTCGQTCRWQVKLCDSSLTRAISERLRDELIIKRYTNKASFIFSLACLWLPVTIFVTAYFPIASDLFTIPSGLSSWKIWLGLDLLT